MKDTYRRRIGDLEAGHITDEPWGVPGEETVKTYAWYVSKSAVAEDVRRLEAGLEPLSDRSCISTTWWWLEQAACNELGHNQEWVSQCVKCRPRLHREGPPGHHGQSKTQPCPCDICVLDRLEEQ